MISGNQLKVLLFLAETRESELTSNEIAEGLRDQVSRSGVYEAVGALQRAGLISARWAERRGHRRRVLRANAYGSKAIANEAAERKRASAAGRRFRPATAI